MFVFSFFTREAFPTTLQDHRTGVPLTKPIELNEPYPKSSAYDLGHFLDMHPNTKDNSKIEMPLLKSTEEPGVWLQDRLKK